MNVWDNEILRNIRKDILTELPKLKDKKIDIDKIYKSVSRTNTGNGCVFVSEYETANYLAKNYFDMQEILEEYEGAIDTSLFFTSICRFHVKLYDLGLYFILNSLDTTDLDDTFIMTDDVIKKLTRQLKDL